MRPVANSTLLLSARRDTAAFTIIELLVTIGIIAVLMSILLPSLGRARAHARTLACLANQRQIGIALLAYAADNRGSYPCHTRWANCMGKKGETLIYDGPDNYTGFADEPGVVAQRPLNSYLMTPEVFRCPDDKGDPYWGGAVTNCFQAFGTSYLIPFELDLFGVGRVTALGAPYGNSPMRIGSRGPASTKIILGDFTWHPNRRLTSPNTVWHASHRAGTERRMNMLFADGHAELFLFPRPYEDVWDYRLPEARVAPDPARGYW